MSLSMYSKVECVFLVIWDHTTKCINSPYVIFAKFPLTVNSLNRENNDVIALIIGLLSTFERLSEK